MQSTQSYRRSDPIGCPIMLENCVTQRSPVSKPSFYETIKVFSLRFKLLLSRDLFSETDAAAFYLDADVLPSLLPVPFAALHETCERNQFLRRHIIHLEIIYDDASLSKTFRDSGVEFLLTRGAQAPNLGRWGYLYYDAIKRCSGCGRASKVPCILVVGRAF